MAKKTNKECPSGTKEARDISTPPSQTIEGRENQLIALAMNATEKRIREGTASAQEIVHFLKLGSTRERLEREIMHKQKDLLTAKTDALQSSKRIEELYQEAMIALRTYKGYAEEDDS